MVKKQIKPRVRTMTEEEFKEKKLVEKIGKALALDDKDFLSKRPVTVHLLPKR